MSLLENELLLSVTSPLSCLTLSDIEFFESTTLETWNGKKVSIEESSKKVLSETSPALTSKSEQLFYPLKELMIAVNDRFLTTMLFTTKVTFLKNKHTILRKWKKIAKQRKVKAGQCNLPVDKQLQTLNSFNIIRSIKCIENQDSTYIAYDIYNRVQAIAYARIVRPDVGSTYEYMYTEIKLMATHPNNTMIFDDDTPVMRGAGTALIRHIAMDTIKSKEESYIRLFAYSTSIPFYKKIGFTRTSPENNVRCIQEQVLTNKDMRLFLESKKYNSIVVDKAPENLI